MVHGFAGLPQITPVAWQAIDDIAGDIRAVTGVKRDAHSVSRGRSRNLQLLDAAQQCAGPILRARQTGGRLLELPMEIAGIVIIASVVLYLLQQIEESLR